MNTTEIKKRLELLEAKIAEYESRTSKKFTHYREKSGFTYINEDADLWMHTNVFDHYSIGTLRLVMMIANEMWKSLQQK